VVAQEHDFALAHQINTLARVGAVTDDVAQAINLGDIVGRDIRQDCLEGFEIAVDIADQSFHLSASPDGRRGTACFLKMISLDR
jgi:hypothetical protein